MANTGGPAGNVVEHDAAGRRGLLARLVRAQEDERRQIAEDIHDHPAQKMSAVGMRLSAIRRRIDEPELCRELDELEATVRRGIDDLRHLTSELRLPDLDREGLGSALRDYVAKTFEHDRLQVEVRCELDPEPCTEVAAVAYRIAQETLRDARGRAGASRVQIELSGARDGGFLTRIADDAPAGGSERTSFAHPDLATVHERAELAGGWVHVRGDTTGTTVEFWLPLDLDVPRAPMAEPVPVGGGFDA